LLAMLNAVEAEEEEREEDTSLAGTTSISIDELTLQKSFLRPIQVVNLKPRVNYDRILNEMLRMAG
jgi:hypothetical protein